MHRTLLALLLAATITSSSFANDPSYKTSQTRQIVEAMVAAHGGYDNWINAPSISFDIAMYLVSLEVSEGRTQFDNWRYYQVTQDPRTTRGYVRLPLEDQDEVQMAFDGTEIWSRDYDFDPTYQDSPFMLLFMHYGWISLPWLTQQDGAVLELAGKSTLPGYDTEFDVVKLRFEDEGITYDGEFSLYINPETHLIGGFSSTASFPRLPGDPITAYSGGNNPNMVRVFDTFENVDGMMMPQGYSTFMPDEDGTPKLVGIHLVIRPSFSQPFDESLLSRPQESEVVYIKGS